ncbi:nitroreductase family protein [Paenibacillus sp. FSL F4-0125]|uniref:nitroreductase family protein n=1 Tax=Paenibacillus sp. FSL F4-0125 TaxID=2954730 RepID=UPI0030F9170A
MLIAVAKKYVPNSLYEFSKEIYIKARIPSWIEKYKLIKNYSYDYKKYSSYAAPFQKNISKESHEADIIFLYHKIEKGLSLKNIKVGFGKGNITELLLSIESYLRKYEWSDVCQVALNSLNAYYSFNKENGIDDNYLLEKIRYYESGNFGYNKDIHVGGTKEITKSDIINSSSMNFKEFAFSRYSIRNFDSTELSLELIKEATNIAQKTPSVCNRQTTRVHVYSSEKIKLEILKHQNGNTGFGENASKIIIVTNNLECFKGANERNQCFIDGGMYAMSLIYALHSLGAGTCALNLAIGGYQDKMLREIAKIDDSEAMIMMIAVGSIPEKLHVAASYRREVESVLKIN